MPAGVVIGIDLGTTMLKAAAFDAKTGRLLAQASQRLAVLSPEPNLREQDPSAMEKALYGTFHRIRKALGGHWKETCGIGLAAQGGSTIIARRETGEALTPMILWNDARAFAYLPDIAKRKPAAYWRRLAARNDPGAGLGRLLWLQETSPGLLTDNNIYVGAGEYVFFRLTRVWRQDAGNAHQIGCYSVPKEDLVQGPLELVGFPLSFFAPMRKGHETHPLSMEAARKLDLPAGIPVAGPYMDHEAGYLSSLSGSTRPLQCSLGTAWVGNFILSPDESGGSPFQLVLPAPVGDGRLVVQPLMTGNVTWDWGLETLVHRDHQRALMELDGIFSEALLPPDGLIALPWFARPNHLVSPAFGAGAFFGLDPHTRPTDLLRALALGMTCEFTRVFQEVKQSGRIDRLVLGGGASKGEFFRSLLAGLFHPLPVFSLEDEDLSGSRGAVYPFSRRAARGKTLKVRIPSRKLIDHLHDAYRSYLKVYEVAYSQVAESGAFHFTKKREPAR